MTCSLVCMSTVSGCINFTHSTEKGVCILGESCPYDHGVDPLVIGGNEMPQFPGPPGILPPHGMPLPPNATKSGEPSVPWKLCSSYKRYVVQPEFHIAVHVLTPL